MPARTPIRRSTVPPHPIPRRTPPMNLDISVGSIADGYPCPKDGTTLELIEGKGAWCSKCHTVWTEVDEVEMPRANGAPCPTCGRNDYPHECWRRRVEA